MSTAASVDDLWNEITEELNQGSMLSAGTKGITYTNGLVGGHAYTIAGAYTLSNGVRLVKVANPWGVDVYKGDWSDSSTLWTPALRAEVSAETDEQDGCFF